MPGSLRRMRYSSSIKLNKVAINLTMTNLYERWIGVRPANLSPEPATKPKRRTSYSAADMFVEAVQELAPIIPAGANDPAAMVSGSLDLREEGAARAPLPEPPKSFAQNAAAAPSAQLPEPSLELLGLPLRDARHAFERAYFQQLLAHEGASIAYIAEKSGLERTHLYRKFRALGMTVGKKVKS